MGKVGKCVIVPQMDMDKVAIKTHARDTEKISLFTYPLILGRRVRAPMISRKFSEHSYLDKCK